MRYAEAHARVAALVESWRKKRYPFEQAETVECPACKGKLRLTQCNQYATPNWVMAQCQSAFCVNYSE